MRFIRKQTQLGALLCGMAVLLVGTSASAHDFRIYLKERLLNRVAQAVGDQSFSGHHVVKTPTYSCKKCVQRNWFGWCTKEITSTCGGDALWSADWSATLSEVQFDITAGGITFAASLDASYGGLPYSTTVSGSAEVDVDGDGVTFAAQQLQVPLVFEVPLVGPVAIYTLSVDLPYSVDLPAGGFYLPSDAAGHAVSSRAINLTRNYYTGQVRLAGDLKFW